MYALHLRVLIHFNQIKNSNEEIKSYEKKKKQTRTIKICIMTVSIVNIHSFWLKLRNYNEITSQKQYNFIQMKYRREEVSK